MKKTGEIRVTEIYAMNCGGRVYRSGVLAVALFSLSLAVIAQAPPPPPPPPGLPPVPRPAENLPTPAKGVLGKILFWDEQLSSDNTVSCGTCHRPAFAGADPRLAINPGADGRLATPDDIIGSPGVVRRDVNNNPIPDAVFGFNPQITGRAAQSYFAAMFAPNNFWDGRATSTFFDPEHAGVIAIQNGGGLESQAVGPILSRAEMAHDGRTWAEVRAKLQTTIPMLLASNVPFDVQQALDAAPTYAQLFTNAFGDPNITAVRIAFAIATYERTLVANQTPWDLFIAGNPTALTDFQRQGWDFLRNNTPCLHCHVPPVFSNNNFFNIGLRPSFEDIGRQAITGNVNDRGRFKTPSLRNVGLKETFMHNGRFNSVQHVLNFYNAGTRNTGEVQFTQDQSPIPGTNQLISQINIPVVTLNGFPAQAAIVDFLTNGLTDPRVAAEQPPFDRPLLLSEMQPIEQVVVRFEYTGPENGGLATPYNTVHEGLVHVQDGGFLRIVTGTTPEIVRIAKPLTITAHNGPVTIGAAPAPAAATTARVGFISAGAQK
jgi:cytochrome c peroxidase